MSGKTEISVGEKLRPISAAMECSAWLLLLAIGCLLVELDILSLVSASLVSIAFIVGLIAAAWKNFDGGRHPCFLFLLMLFVFQCGRLVGLFTGFPTEPFAIQVQTVIPLSVHQETAQITLLLICFSAACVYIPCRLAYRPIIFTAGKERNWLRDLYGVLALCIPFAVYKNLVYFSYIRSHGGYMAVYVDNGEILQSAGTLVRLMALVGTTACLLLYLFERRRRYVRFILVVYLSVSIMDLMIGFRGKFFVQLIVLWFIHNLKNGKRFNFAPLFITAAIIMLVAAPLAGFREERDIAVTGPLAVLATQGISMNVTEVAVENRPLFEKNKARYLWGDLRGMVSSNDDNLASDISIYLSPEAFREGFATGSTYLAEAYILGGFALVMIASLAIGWALSMLHLHSHSWPGAVLLLASIGPFIYMPRGSLMDPLTGTFKFLTGAGVAALFALLVRVARGCIRLASRTHA
ncbi:O-antigen polysaccharide polymerase Wzy family protein [Occallatibacter riparius]|uniref:O-antigen polysaccharide polymerase Wzy family protein n=1 Tax=Occallatibacter riparius TaxID=1002689 RepID=A0A9J7BX89_9BACT|nr:O-antigen polysaccharide polymerase Wzy family protein [Occallatibacter riparius]UWZ85558.1 O-antigen polysaccharide polymerase Wzy family protein [Occallatibacter riparius]